MNILLSILLIILGLLLWVGAGLLPIVKLREEEKALTLTLETTWMGAVRLSRREVAGIHDARFVQDPNSGRRGQVQIQRNNHWEPLSVGPLPEVGLQAQLAEIVRRFIQRGGPQQLSLPMRGRLSLMIGFGTLFPLGTVSIFAGVLLLTGAM